MRHLLQLLADRAIQDRVAMSVDVGPDGRVAIQVPPAVAVFQPCSLTGNQHQWLVLRRNPISHRREGMPHVGLVELDEGLGVVIHGENSEVRIQELQEFRSRRMPKLSSLAFFEESYKGA